MAIDISHLLGKVENGGTTPAGKLSAAEFNTLINAAIELQNDMSEVKRKAVYRVVQGTTPYDPINNIITLPGADTTVSVLTPDNTDSIIKTDGKAKVHLRFTSVQGGSDTAEIVNVQVQVYSVGEWVTKGSFQASTQGFTFDPDSPNSYTEYDITQYLSAGSNQVRIQATGLETGVTGRLVFSSIVLTSLYVVNQQNYNVPINAADGGFSFAYQVYGAVSKTLHVKISGLTQDLTLEYELGTTQYTTENFSRVVAEQTGYGILTHGVHTVTAWLTCEDGDGETISSDVLVNRFMVINNETATEAQRTKPYLMLQEMKSTVVNYVQTSLCGYAIFVPKIDDNDQIVLDTEASLNLAFIISNYSEDAMTDTSLVEYLRVEEVVHTNTRNNLNVTVEIEPASESAEEASSYDAYLHVWRMITNADGEVTGKSDILADSIGSDMISITVDNSDSFAPTSGSTFLLNPKVRNNSEANYQRILNARNNNAVIPSTWVGFSGVNDGWITSSDDNQKVLRVLAGQRITIEYNPFVQYLSNPESSMTFEMDFKVRNVTDPEDNQILGINETNAAGTMIGLRMNAMRAFLLTTSNNVEAQQDWSWREDVRTHVSININHSVVAQTGATPMSLVRVLINGKINREFQFATNRYNEFCSAALSNGGIVIGSDSADIDIYSLRCYTNKQLSATNIVKNYIATLPTSAEKLQARKENAITDEATGLISVAGVRGNGKRVLIWHGVEPYQMLSSKQKGYWEIYQYDSNGNYLPEYSGTICKDSYLAYLEDNSVSCLEASRQGSTANTYYYSNLQTKIKDVEFEISVLLSKIHSSITVVDNGDDTVTLTGGNISGTYELNEDGESINVVDGWIDGNGMYRGNGYQVAASVPLGQKMVNKINYASSMQSHLCGGVSSYNDLHTAVVGRNSLQTVANKARVAKYTEPFFFFVQENETDEPVYRGACTFGPGKMDDVTWGFDKNNSAHTDFCMIEGAENNYPLTDMRVPWDHNVKEHVSDGEVDGWGYPNADSVNIDLDKAMTHKVNGVKVPIDSTIELISDAWNFLYWHNPRMTYYNNTYENFMIDTGLDQTMAYWLTQGTYKYCLFRYDMVTETWVHAGMWQGTPESGAYAVRNLQTDPITSGAITADNQSNYAALNQAFINALVVHAKQNIGDYFNVRSLQFHYAYVNFFLAGTDNCSKNTYYVIDPATKLFELHQDDLDTTLPTDNTGRNTKPYYIDRMHPYAEGSNISLYEGGANTLFNLCELMYENTRELQDMMHSIFTAMCGLVSANDDLGDLTQTQKTTPWGFLHKYFFNVQRYFPAIAWNEQARIRYEYPASLGFVSTGGRAVPPITQSLGDQLESEKQYMKRRLVYAASYARWGDFEYATTGSVGLDDTAASFGFQGYPNPDGTTAAYAIDITPHQYIYPTANIGGNTIDPHVRLAPGESYHFNLGNVNGDTGVAIFASNYYRNFGNVGNISCKADSTFTLQGKRLTSFTANPTVFYTDQETGEQVPAFRPQQFVIDNATGLNSISLNGCVGIRGSFDGSRLIRANTIDLTNTAFTEVTLPESQNLEVVKLPSKLVVLDIDNIPNLTTLVLSGYDYLNTIKVGNNVGTVNTYALVYNACVANAQVQRLVLNNINWENVSMTVLNWLLGIADCVLTGEMTITEPTPNVSVISFATKMQVVYKWGNVDDATADNYMGLLMNYTRINLVSMEISGEAYLRENNKDYQYTMAATPRGANNVCSIGWSVTSPTLDGIISMNSRNGILHCTQISSEIDYVTVSVAVKTYENGTYREFSESKEVGVYNRAAQIGDYVYADGSYSDELDPGKTVVGICFYINPDDPTDRRMVAVANTTPNATEMWGLYNNASNGLANITLVDDPTYNVYDLAKLTNVTVKGLVTSAGANNDYVTDDTYRDELYGDDLGFKILARGSAAAEIEPVTLTENILDHRAGETMPVGQLNTLKIIEHRNKVLDDTGVNLPIPSATMTQSETDNLTDCIAAVVASGGANKYRQYYFPAASYCYAYQPAVMRGEVLADKFKAHNWYLPSAGELCRMYWYHSKGYTNGTTNAIFAKAKNAGKFTQFTANYYWASTEYSSTHAWSVNFSNGYLDTYGSGKYYAFYVRAVAAF